MGAVSVTSWYWNSMEAILADHPALSTGWPGWVEMSCELRIHTGTIILYWFLCSLCQGHFARRETTWSWSTHEWPGTWNGFCRLTRWGWKQHKTWFEKRSSLGRPHASIPSLTIKFSKKKKKHFFFLVAQKKEREFCRGIFSAQCRLRLSS